MKHIKRFILLMLLCSTAIAADEFVLTTNDIPVKTDLIPIQFTCDGQDIAPKLTWANAPKGTKSFVLIMLDPDAPEGTWFHWIVYNIPPTVNTIGGDPTQLPAGALFGVNSFGNLRYNGPCPPKGSNHMYVFALYALDIVLNIEPEPKLYDVESAMGNHMIMAARTSGRYGR